MRRCTFGQATWLGSFEQGSIVLFTCICKQHYRTLFTGLMFLSSELWFNYKKNNCFETTEISATVQGERVEFVCSWKSGDGLNLNIENFQILNQILPLTFDK